MTTTVTNMAVGCEVRREYPVDQYSEAGKIVGRKQAYDLGTVVEVSGERVRVLWHTYRADLPAGVCTIKPKRTWVKASVVRLV